jgi:hypothetical protein
MAGSPGTDWIRTVTRLRRISWFVKTSTSRINSLMSTRVFSAGLFFKKDRILWITSPARFPSLTIRSTAT